MPPARGRPLPWATAVAAAVGPGGKGGEGGGAGIDRVGDTSGYYTKPQKTTQGHGRYLFLREPKEPEVVPHPPKCYPG